MKLSVLQICIAPPPPPLRRRGHAHEHGFLFNTPSFQFSGHFQPSKIPPSSDIFAQVLDNTVGGGSSDSETVEGYKECNRCGDHIMPEFLEAHVRMVHGEEGGKVRAREEEEGSKVRAREGRRAAR